MENVGMLVTKNYSIFKDRTGNRELNRGHILNMSLDLKEYNFLRDKPVNVDKEMIIIDGHHRVAAATMAGVEVYYTVVQREGAEANAMLVSANLNQRQFKIDDYVNFYADNGSSEYRFLRDMQRKFNFQYRVLVSFASGINDASGKTGRGHLTKARGPSTIEVFKHGGFNCTNKEEFLRRCIFMQKVYDIFDLYLKMQSKFYRSVQFATALKILGQHPDFNEEHFLKNLERQWTMIGPQSTTINCIKMFYNIYNWHLKIKLSWDLLDIKEKSTDVMDI